MCLWGLPGGGSEGEEGAQSKALGGGSRISVPAGPLGGTSCSASGPHCPRRRSAFCSCFWKFLPWSSLPGLSSPCTGPGPTPLPTQGPAGSLWTAGLPTVHCRVLRPAGGREARPLGVYRGACRWGLLRVGPSWEERPPCSSRALGLVEVSLLLRPGGPCWEGEGWARLRPLPLVSSPRMKGAALH